ncbi:DUF2075 family protein [Streptomyces sp. Ncost-T10-10d]|nr:DUF2075 family protein [Streptomyces sp. Ncost-T10-10d]
MIDRLRRILDSLGHPLGSAELLDVLLLARTMAASRKDVLSTTGSGAGKEADLQADDSLGPASDSEQMADLAETSGTGPEGGERQQPGTPSPGKRHMLFPDTRPQDPSTGSAAHSLRIPGPRALPGANHLVRSLRPLREHREHPRRTVVDVEATVRLAAESDIFDVVLRPTSELQNTAVFLIDDSPSMRVWRSLLSEVGRLVERSGVFRTVEIRKFTPEELVRRHRVRSVGPSVVFLLTDGVHRAWASSAMANAVAALGARGPVTVLTPLPQRLWRATGFQPQPCLLRATQRFPAIRELSMLDPVTGECLQLGPGRVPLPVVALSPSSLASWAQLMTRPTASQMIESALLGSPGASPPAEPVTADESAPPDKLIAAFRGSFSPQAYSLAVRLSAITTLSPLVMQLVRTATLPEATSTHVAEVLLGGLLQRRDDAADTQELPETLREHDLYTFRPGVRELLATGLSRAQTHEVTVAVGRALAPYLGRLPDFSVLVPDVAGTHRISEEALPFAALAGPRTDSAPSPTASSVAGSDIGGQETSAALGGAALFRAPARVVAADALRGSLILLLIEQHVSALGRRPTAARVRAWEQDLPELAAALMDVGLGEVEMLIEYGLPMSSFHVSVVLAGLHPVHSAPSYVLVELKPWTRATLDEDDPVLCYGDATSRPVLNPVEQVRRYREYLIRVTRTLSRNPERVSGVAYLPRATEAGLSGLRELERDARVHLFTGERRREFLDHLRARFSDSRAGERAADELLQATSVRSDRLMAVAAQEVRDRQQFMLLDEQQVAYRLVLNAVEKAKDADRKEVVIVTGGPGTGKSVIALQLLGELYRRGVPVLHATGSQAFTKTMRKVAGARKREVQDLFKYFNSFMTAEKNSLGVLICDEAHRIRETSANRYTPAAHRTGRAQVDELIDVASVPVFFLDEHQVVRPGEMGTVAAITAAAQRKGLPVRVVPLGGQFGCGGSAAYLNWVVRLLELEPGGPARWEPDGRMQLLVAESPEEMEAFLAARRSEGHSARMTAGYCWRWSSEPKPGDPLPLDVVIGDWARPWTLRGDRSVSGAPPSALWATDPAGFGQMGVIYTAQGFEYDWSGVVLGPDLVWRGDRFVTDRTSSKDPVFSRSVSDAETDRLIRTAYKVLLTRGLMGTVVYSTDAETRAQLRDQGAQPLHGHSSRAEESAVAALTNWPHRLADLSPRITAGFHETNGRAAGFFDRYPGPVEGWQDVILQGSFISAATPFHKQPPEGRARGVHESESWNHLRLAADAVPRTNYRPTGPPARYLSAQDRWVDHDRLTQLLGDPVAVLAAHADVSATDLESQGGDRDKAAETVLRAASTRPCSEFYRVAWRALISPDTERSLHAALVPPGANHLHTMRSAALPSPRLTVLTAGFFASLPLDDFLRRSGRLRLDTSAVGDMPAPSPEHPLESALLLRTLRLNCQTNAYAPLWEELYDSSWRQDAWAASAHWPESTPPLTEGVGPTWNSDVPLRTEFARRAALVEIDALVAVWLGISADALVTMYDSRFPVLQRNEESMWFDATGRRIAELRRQHGYDQPKVAWGQLSSHERFPSECNVPDGYAGPLYRAHRKDEMREAHAEFSRRLSEIGRMPGDTRHPDFL